MKADNSSRRIRASLRNSLRDCLNHSMPPNNLNGVHPQLRHDGLTFGLSILQGVSSVIKKMAII